MHDARSLSWACGFFVPVGKPVVAYTEVRHLGGPMESPLSAKWVGTSKHDGVSEDLAAARSTSGHGQNTRE